MQALLAGIPVYMKGRDVQEPLDAGGGSLLRHVQCPNSTHHQTIWRRFAAGCLVQAGQVDYMSHSLADPPKALALPHVTSPDIHDIGEPGWDRLTPLGEDAQADPRLPRHRLDDAPSQVAQATGHHDHHGRTLIGA